MAILGKIFSEILFWTPYLQKLLNNMQNVTFILTKKNSITRVSFHVQDLIGVRFKDGITGCD